MPPGSPAEQRRRINGQLLGRLPLRQAKPSTRSGKAIRRGDGGRHWVIPEELDDFRDIADSRGVCVASPVRNRGFVNADLVGNLLLEEVEVQAMAADVVR